MNYYFINKMLVFKSIMQRYLSKYFENKSNYRGVSFFFRLYSFAQQIDLLLLKSNTTREDTKLMNKMFAQYWNEKVNGRETKKILMNMFIWCEQKLNYIYDVEKRFSDYIDTVEMDSGFNPGKWSPLMVATECME